MKNYYRNPPILDNWLEKNGFRLSNIYSDNEMGEAYSITFPCYKWGTHITLICEAVIWKDSGNVLINVFDNNQGTRSRYAPYYLQSETHRTLLDSIDNTINRTLKRMGLHDYDTNEPMRDLQAWRDKRRKQSKNKSNMQSKE